MIDALMRATTKVLPSSAQRIFRGAWSREGFKKYLVHTLWIFLTRFVLMGASFFITALVARHLTPANFGLMNYVIGFVGLFSFIASFGIDAILGRELILHSEKRAKILGNAIMLYSISCLMAFGLTNIVAIFSDPDTYTQTLIFVMSLTFLFQPTSPLAIFFQSTVQGKKIAYVQFVTTLVSILLKVIGIYLGVSITWFLGIFIVESATSALAVIYFFRKTREHIDFSLDTTLMLTLARHAFPFMLSIVATGIYMKIDQIMLKHMLDTVQTGIYSVAVRLTEAWYFIPNLLTTSLFPAIAHAKRTNEIMYYSRIKQLLILMIILAIVTILPLALFAKEIISILYGVAYIGAYSSFMVYIWSSIPVFLMPALSAYMTTEHRGYTLLISTTIGALVNIMLNILLIPHYGIVGSALATFISYIIPAGIALGIFLHKQKVTRAASVGT